MKHPGATSGINVMVMLHPLLLLSALSGVQGASLTDTTGLVLPLEEVSPSFEFGPPEESIADFSRLLGGKLTRSKSLRENDEQKFQRVFDYRSKVNDIYGDFDTGQYGGKTRSILRYKHSDKVDRNLCVYSNKTHIFDYPMYNYQISPPVDSFVEVKYTTKMKSINKGVKPSSGSWGSLWRRALQEDGQGENETETSQSRGQNETETSQSRELWGRIARPTPKRKPTRVAPVEKSRLHCKRPVASDGFNPVGDVLYKDGVRESAKTPMLVRGHKNVLQPPVGFVEVETEEMSESPTLWRPIPPGGFVCLGYVCTDKKTTRPSKHLYRCVRSDFVEQTKMGVSYRNPLGTVWNVSPNERTMASATFVARACTDCHAPGDEMYGLKKQCVPGVSNTPFCKQPEANFQVKIVEHKTIKIPYAELRPCAVDEEDQTDYGLHNEDSKWQDYAVEIYKDNKSGFVGYKHYGVSQREGKPYCLGSIAFGTSLIKNDLFLREVMGGVFTPTQAAELRAGKHGELGRKLSAAVKGDFVFLFPCSGTNEPVDYRAILQQKALKEDGSGRTENGVVTMYEDLGVAAKFGIPEWRKPHYCGMGEEPSPTGQCKKVQACSYEVDKCKAYDEFDCEKDDDCASGKCLRDQDKKCGELLNLYGGDVKTFQVLPRSIPYGIEQDGPGKFLNKEGQVSLYGNTWKAFKIHPQTVQRRTTLSFDFRLDEEAEGHAICLDEDINEDVEIKGANRCFRLGGTQDELWSEVFQAEGYTIRDSGWKNDHTGFYDLEGDGHCNGYCRWIGNSRPPTDLHPNGAGTSFAKGRRQYGSSWWSCQVSAWDWSSAHYTGPQFTPVKCAARHSLEDTSVKHYKFKLGSLEQGYAKEEPYFPWDTQINYLALVQDNDASPSVGVSRFSNLQLYEDGMDTSVSGIKKDICDRRKLVNQLWSSANPGEVGSATRSIARYNTQGRNLCVKDTGREWNYAMSNYKAQPRYSLNVKYHNQYEKIYYGKNNDGHTFSAWRPKTMNDWYRLGHVSMKKHGAPNFSSLLVKASGDILEKPTSYHCIWRDPNNFGGYASLWRPNPKRGYVCLGYVWQPNHDAPSTNEIRCVKAAYADQTTSSERLWYMQNKHERHINFGLFKVKVKVDFPHAGDVYKPKCNGNQLDAGTMFGESNRLYVLKKQCTREYGTFPYCGDVHLEVDKPRTFALPYAQLVSCGFDNEDVTVYPNLKNKGADNHSPYEVELYKGASGFIGYKHNAISKRKGSPYCLGTKVFGDSKVKIVANLLKIGKKGYMSKGELDSQRANKHKYRVNDEIKGDFVFLFPCSKTNDIKNYYDELQTAARKINEDPSRVAGVAAGSNDLGQAATVGYHSWKKPHICGCGQEPIAAGGCYAVIDGCYYDAGVCPKDSTCARDASSCVCHDGYTSELDGTKTIFSHTSGDSCLPASVSLHQEISGTSFTFNVDNSKRQKFNKFRIAMTREDAHSPDQAPLSVHDYDKKIATSTDTTFKYTFENLMAGMRYDATFTPIDSNGNVISGELVQKTNVATHCCCVCESSIQKDTSGRPLDFTAYQVRGQVMFEFVDNSRCAEAYAFTRAEVDEEFMDNSDESIKKVFTPNYNYYPKTVCGNAPVLPGLEAADDLHTSKLQVGEPYRYCVRAVAQLYSVESIHSSDETCDIHYVRWQASFDGEVTSSLDSGALPIQDATVSWELMNQDQTVVIATGSVVTGKPGKFLIEFDQLHEDLNRDDEFPVRIKFSKQTEVGAKVIDHQFSCKQGTLDCTEDGVVVYLKHLTFDKPVASYDMTAVPIRGVVKILEEEGCPVIGADVCVKIKHPCDMEDTDGGCVKTDHNGEYEAVAAIGAKVAVEVSYNNHTFIKGSQNFYDYEKGVFMDITGRYERNDFIDTTKAPLIVEVAGGLCNKVLGKSIIEVKVNGCDSWQLPLAQSGFEREYSVPAHVLDVRVTEVTDDKGKPHYRIQDHFAEDSMVRTIDLLDVGEEEEEIEAVKEKEVNKINNPTQAQKMATIMEEEERDIDRVRFQFDGTLVVDFRFLADVDEGGECTFDDMDPLGDVSEVADSNSLHVTPTGTQFVPMVLLKYELLENLFCSIVNEDEISVNILNSVGIDDDPDPPFDDFLAKITDDSMKAKLLLCSHEAGCTFKVTHDELAGKKSNAHMALVLDDDTTAIFLTGRPKVDGDFRKDFIVKVLDSDNQILYQHNAQVLVTGDFVTGPGDSFALPTYQPIMILRDPPGGMSSATYENVQTTVKVTSTEIETISDFEFHASLGGSLDNVHSLCLGFIVAYQCNEVLKYDVGVTLGGGYEESDVDKHDEDTYTSEYTTTWSYTTSDDPLRAGRNSDIFVTPNLNVNYNTVETIKFFKDQCLANNTRTVKFALKDPGNAPALSFFTLYNIETGQIPKLSASIGDKAAEVDAEEDDAKKKELQTQEQTLRDALSAWEDIVRDYNDTNVKAEKGELEIPARDWFDKWASKKETAWESQLPQLSSGDHWSNLAPESLVDRAEALNFDYITDAGLDTSDKEDLKQTNRIQFSGGGGTVEFAMSFTGDREDEEIQSDLDNLETRPFGAGDGEIVFAALGAEFTISVEGGLDTDTTKSNTESKEKGKETSISFVLGDEQKDDEFALDIYIDPKFGTFVFHTTSGLSSQPWEPGTKRGEDIRLEIQRPSKPVMPDEPLVFHLDVANYATPTNYFNLFLDHTTNKGGLIHRLGGDGLAIAPEFGPFNGEASFTLEVFRGPKGYLFEPSVFQLSGIWDEDGAEAKTVQIYNHIDKEGNFWIKYEEPCPQIDWVGSLKREKKFVIDKAAKEIPLTVFNPGKQAGSFEEMAIEGRLENVFVWYREVGGSQWKKALLDDLSQIDFANIPKSDWKEDKYGFAMIPWDFAKRLTLNDDGVYEIKIESTCKEVPGAPDDFNAFSVEPILVVVDRVEPEMYGKALPIRSDVVPGEEVVMMFTEPIDCEIPYRFNLTVTVDGLDDLFDKRNLKIFCEDRKLSFQFDPIRIKYDLLMGRVMTVYVDEVRDLQGNYIPQKIKFEKSIADLNVGDVSAEFDIRLDLACGSSETIDELEDVQKPISSMLRLNDPNRVKVVSSVCHTTYIQAKVKILAGGNAAARRRLRADQHLESVVDEEDISAMDAFYTLLESSSSRRLFSTDHSDLRVSFEVDSLKIIPGDSDIERFSLNAQPTIEEELILAAGEGCDEHAVQQRELMLRSEQRVTAQLNETQAQIGKVANELASITDAHIEDLDNKIGLTDKHVEDLHSDIDHKMDQTDAHIETMDLKIDQTDSHIETVDRKLDDLLAMLSKQQEGPALMGPHNKDEWDRLLSQLEMEHQRRIAYQSMSFGFVLFASITLVLVTMFHQCKRRAVLG